jgi:NAD-dependent DNA ligase
MARQNESTDLWAVVQVMECSGALKGKSVCVTGHVGVPRAELVRIIETAGGRFEERPRYGTTYLVTNKDFTKGSTVEPKRSTKMIEAERNRVKVISEAQFCQMIIDGSDA